MSVSASSGELDLSDLPPESLTAYVAQDADDAARHPDVPGYVRPGLKVGFHAPEQCARGRADCRSLSQIVSSDGETFICCGEVAPGATPFARDQWSFCLRGEAGRAGVEGTDVRFFVDRRDLSHMAAVTAMGLAAVIPPDADMAPPALHAICVLCGWDSAGPDDPPEECWGHENCPFDPLSPQKAPGDGAGNNPTEQKK